jgi:hypothetical protein
MKTNFTSLSVIVLALSFGASVSALAQDSQTDQHVVTVVIPTVALLDLETSVSKNITATFVAPTEAGLAITAPADDQTLWLNYSSIQTLSKTKRVDVETASLIAGVDVNLSAAASGTGAGALGTAQAPFDLIIGTKKLIDGIGSAYTTSGPSKGHQLTYKFTAADANYANLRSGSPTITVV